MRIKIELFGRAATQSGEREALLDLEAGATLRDVAAALVERYPALEWIPAIARPALNLEYAAWDDPVDDGDEVSFIPPVSGG
jgi:molybdopterin converting factor small subunit